MAARFKDGEKTGRETERQRDRGTEGRQKKNKAVTDRIRQTEKHQSQHNYFSNTKRLVSRREGLDCSLTYLSQAEGDGAQANAGVLLQGEHKLVDGITDGRMSADKSALIREADTDT